MMWICTLIFVACVQQTRGFDHEEIMWKLKRTTRPSITAREQHGRNGEADGCALLFFGLPKQFRSTVLPSIRTHILASNAACAVYAHTYNISKVTTLRNGERAAPIFAAEVRALTPNVTMDSIEAIPHDLARFRRYDRVWRNAESMDNMVKQWHSIERVWGSMRAAERRRGRGYARVGLFRLDVMYKTDVRLNDGARAVIPDFGHWYNDPKRGLNDRMFYGDRAYAEQWATARFSQVDAYVASHNNTLHSESFMLYLMRDVPVTLKPICFWRVRAIAGRVKRNDCKYLGKYSSYFYFRSITHFKSAQKRRIRPHLTAEPQPTAVITTTTLF